MIAGYLFGICSLSVFGASLDGECCDGTPVTLNAAGKVTFVVYCTEAIQEETENASFISDEFKGLPGFRNYVLVDLRNSMANWAKGYTRRRMMRDLEQEFIRLKPIYLKNKNSGDISRDIGAIPDFEGSLCMSLGWKTIGKTARVILFDRQGREIYRKEVVTNAKELRSKIELALGN